MNRIEPPPPQHQRLARTALAAADARTGPAESTAPDAPRERLFHGIAVSAGVAIGPVFGTTEPGRRNHQT
jgi:hypothetical protein